VNGGDGVIVSGTGTPTNPYVVTATRGHLQVTDTSTVNLTLGGDGTVANPHSVSAVAKVSTDAVGNLVTAEADGLAVTCKSVQECVGAGFTGGLLYDGSAGEFRAQLSLQAGNALTVAEDGGLFVPTPAVDTARDVATQHEDYQALINAGIPAATAARLTGFTPPPSPTPPGFYGSR